MKRLIPLILCLALVSCGGETAETTTTTETAAAAGGEEDVAATTTEAPTTTTTEAPTTTAEATTTTTVPEPTSAECLVGTWELDSEAFVATIAEEMGPQVPGDVSFGGGSYVVEMNDDGTFTSIRDEWRWLMETPQGDVVVEIDGEETGTYSVDGDTMTASVTGGEATVEMGVEVGGELQPLPFMDQMEFQTEAVDGTGTYECSGDTLQMTLNDFTSVFMRR